MKISEFEIQLTMQISIFLGGQRYFVLFFQEVINTLVELNFTLDGGTNFVFPT